MKRAWANELELFSEILEVADKHNIQVWLDYGSLLGAVRHGGFIPWDDDLDISVMRKDFIPLLKYLQEELPPYRSVESIYTVQNYIRPKAVVLNRKSLDIGNDPEARKITDINFNFPCRAWVDIFPMDYIPKDTEQLVEIKTIYSLAYGLASEMEVFIETGTFEDYLSQLEKYSGIKIKRDENIRHSLWILCDNISGKTKKHEANGVLCYQDLALLGPSKYRPLSAFKDTILVPFEMITAPVPIGYDEILTLTYGNRYLTPQKGTSAHLYPFFKDHEKLILSHSRIGQLGDIF